MPKISFNDPLPMGMEGAHEFFFISVKGDMACDVLVQETNQELPEGLFIHHCEEAGPRSPVQGFPVDHYSVTLKTGVFNRSRLAWFAERERIEYTFTNKKGLPGTIDLKSVVLSIDLIKPNSIQVVIQNTGGKRIRPAIVLEQVFALPKEDIQEAFIVKGGNHV
jgi:radical SAM-linked protein